MIPLLDAAVILALAGLAYVASAQHSWPALPVGLWLAATTPLLVRADLARHRLPDLATLPAGGLALAAAVVAAVDGRAIGPLLALAVAVAAGLVAWSRGALGLGDVKLGASVVAGAQFADADGALTAVAVCGLGGLVGLVGARWSSSPSRPSKTSTLSAASTPKATSPRESGAVTRIAYGPCLLAGYWAAVVVGALR